MAPTTAETTATAGPRRSIGRVLVVLAVTLVGHAWMLERARRELDVDLPAPVSTVQAELFRLPAPIAVGESAPPRPPPRATRAIVPPEATVREPEAAAPPAAPDAVLQPADAAAADPAAPAQPEVAAPEAPEAPEPPAAPLDAVMVSFPRVGRFVSDTAYYKGLLRVFGTTRIEWRIGADRYSARSVTADDTGRVLITIDSEGDVRPSVGVAPRRYTEQRIGRAPLATNFQWEADPPKVTFSSSSREFPLQEGVQDRLSFMAQLALLAQAFPQRFVPGESVALELAGTRDVRVYEFRAIAWESIRTGVGIVDALKLERVLAPGQRDIRIELWLVPALRWLPARTVTTLPGEDVIETVLKEATFE